MALDSPEIVRLLTAERNRLFAYIWAIVGDVHLAEDVFQEVSLLVVEKGAELTDEPELRVWLRRAARYKAIDAVRQAKRRPAALDESIVEKLEEYWVQYDAMPESDLVETLRECMRLLTPNGRKLMVLRYTKGLRTSQIAQRLNRQVTTVRRSIARAHRSLHDCVRTQACSKESEPSTMSEAEIQSVPGHESVADFADLVAGHLAGELNDAHQKQLTAELAALPERRTEFVAMCIQAQLVAACVGLEFAAEECLDDFSDDEDSWSGQTQRGFFPISLPHPHPPLHHSPQHRRLFLLGLAGGVSDCNGNFRGWAADRLRHACVPACTGRQAIVSAQPDGRRAEAEVVGRITGMVDCKWADHATEASDGDRVPLGRQYALASGLMEITYDTGAKVILQGPVTYEVESAADGFLSVGKLTARVEKKNDECGMMNDELRTGASGIHHSSFITHPLFAVRTPTATVTDLGTEFGVEVSKEGSTTSHVFRGSIEMRVTSADKKTQSMVRVLHANESARVENKGNPDGAQREIVFVPSAEPVEFVREISQGTSKPLDRFEVVASWQFDGDNFLADSSGHGHTLVNRGAVQVGGAASFNGSAMMRTSDSIDLTPYAKVRVSWSSKAATCTPNQVVWEHGPNYNYMHGAIIAYIDGGEGFAGLRNDLQGIKNDLYSQPDTHRVEVCPLASGTWENYVVEFDRTSARRSGIVKVFENGVLIGRGTAANGPAPASFANAAFYIGAREGAKVLSSSVRSPA